MKKKTPTTGIDSLLPIGIEIVFLALLYLALVTRVKTGEVHPTIHPAYGIEFHSGIAIKEG